MADDDLDAQLASLLGEDAPLPAPRAARSPGPAASAAAAAAGAAAEPRPAAPASLAAALSPVRTDKIRALAKRPTFHYEADSSSGASGGDDDEDEDGKGAGAGLIVKGPRVRKPVNRLVPAAPKRDSDEKKGRRSSDGSDDGESLAAMLKDHGARQRRVIAEVAKMAPGRLAAAASDSDLAARVARLEAEDRDERGLVAAADAATAAKRGAGGRGKRGAAAVVSDDDSGAGPSSSDGGGSTRRLSGGVGAGAGSVAGIAGAASAAAAAAAAADAADAALPAPGERLTHDDVLARVLPAEWGNDYIGTLALPRGVAPLAGAAVRAALATVASPALPGGTQPQGGGGVDLYDEDSDALPPAQPPSSAPLSLEAAAALMTRQHQWARSVEASAAAAAAEAGAAAEAASAPSASRSPVRQRASGGGAAAASLASVAAAGVSAGGGGSSLPSRGARYQPPSSSQLAGSGLSSEGGSGVPRRSLGGVGSTGSSSGGGAGSPGEGASVQPALRAVRHYLRSVAPQLPAAATEPADAGAFPAAYQPIDAVRFPSVVPQLPAAMGAPLALCGGPIDVTPCVAPPPPHPLLTAYATSPLYTHTVAEAARRQASPHRSRSRSFSFGGGGGGGGDGAAGGGSGVSAAAAGTSLVSPSKEAADLCARLRRHDPGCVWAPLAPVLLEGVAGGAAAAAAQPARKEAGTSSSFSAAQSAPAADAGLPAPIAALSSAPALGCGNGYGTHALLAAPCATALPDGALLPPYPDNAAGAATAYPATTPPFLPARDWLAAVQAFTAATAAAGGAVDASSASAPQLTALAAATDAFGHSVGVHAVSLAPMPPKALRRLRALLRQHGGHGATGGAGADGDDTAAAASPAASPTSAGAAFAVDDDVDPDEFDESDDDDVDDGVSGGGGGGGSLRFDRPVYLYHRSQLLAAAKVALLLLCDPSVAGGAGPTAQGGSVAHRSPADVVVVPAAKRARKGDKSTASAAVITPHPSAGDAATRATAAHARGALVRLLAALTDVLSWRDSVLDDAWTAAHARLREQAAAAAGAAGRCRRSSVSSGDGTGAGGTTSDDGESDSDGAPSAAVAAPDEYAATRAEAARFSASAEAVYPPWAVELVEAALHACLRPAFAGPGSGGAASASTAAPASYPWSATDPSLSPPPGIARNPVELGLWLQSKGAAVVGARVAVWNERSDPPHWRSGVLTAFHAHPTKLSSTMTAPALSHTFTAAQGAGRAHLRLREVLVRPLTPAELARDAAGTASLGVAQQLAAALPFPDAGCLLTLTCTLTDALACAPQTRGDAASALPPLGPRLFSASAAAAPTGGAPPPFPPAYHYVASSPSRSPLGVLARRLALVSAHALIMASPAASAPVRAAAESMARREQRRAAAALARLQARLAPPTGTAAARAASSGAAGTGAGAGGRSAGASTAATKAKAAAQEEVASGKQRDVRDMFHRAASTAAAAAAATAAAAASSSAAATAAVAAAPTLDDVGGDRDLLALSLSQTQSQGPLEDDDVEMDGVAGGPVNGGSGSGNDASTQSVDSDDEGDDDDDDDSDDEAAAAAASAAAASAAATGTLPPPDAPLPWLPRLKVSLLRELGQAGLPPPKGGADVAAKKGGSAAAAGSSAAAAADDDATAHPCGGVLTRPSGLLLRPLFAVAKLLMRLDPAPPRPPPWMAGVSSAVVAGHWASAALVAQLLRDAVALLAQHAAPPSPLAVVPAAGGGGGSSGSKDAKGSLRFTTYPAAWAAPSPAADDDDAPLSSLLQPPLLAPYPVPPACRPLHGWHDKAARAVQQWEATAVGKRTPGTSTLPAQRFGAAARALSAALGAFTTPEARY